MIAIRPERTQRPVQIAVTDLYRLLLRSEAARATLERARAAKARKAERRERQRIDRQEKAFRKKLKEGRH